MCVCVCACMRVSVCVSVTMCSLPHTKKASHVQPVLPVPWLYPMWLTWRPVLPVLFISLLGSMYVILFMPFLGPVQIGAAKSGPECGSIWWSLPLHLSTATVHYSQAQQLPVAWHHTPHGAGERPRLIPRSLGTQAPFHYDPINSWPRL